MAIKTHRIPANDASAGVAIPGPFPLLAGEIAGVATDLVRIEGGSRRASEPVRGSARVCLFFRGKGNVRFDACGSVTATLFRVAEPAILALSPDAPFAVEAGKTGVEYLDIRVGLTDRELAALEGASPTPPHFLAYSEAPLYREEIKSPKTVNRTLVPEGLVPRCSIGSVQTEGPDRVGAHSHPMLEQLFFGLPGNDCLVDADGTEVPFGEDTLLHIPLGSHHGATVTPGCLLHYVWMDFFTSQEDMAYIREQHRDI